MSRSKPDRSLADVLPDGLVDYRKEIESFVHKFRFARKRVKVDPLTPLPPRIKRIPKEAQVNDDESE